MKEVVLCHLEFCITDENLNDIKVGMKIRHGTAEDGSEFGNLGLFGVGKLNVLAYVLYW